MNWLKKNSVILLLLSFLLLFSACNRGMSMCNTYKGIRSSTAYRVKGKKVKIGKRKEFKVQLYRHRIAGEIPISE